MSRCENHNHGRLVDHDHPLEVSQEEDPATSRFRAGAGESGTTHLHETLCVDIRDRPGVGLERRHPGAIINTPQCKYETG